MQRRKPETRECAFCGTKFKTAYRGQKYCCDSCRVLAYRERKEKGLVKPHTKVGNAGKTPEKVQILEPAPMQQYEQTPVRNYFKHATLGEALVGGAIALAVDSLFGGNNTKKRKKY